MPPPDSFDARWGQEAGSDISPAGRTVLRFGQKTRGGRAANEYISAFRNLWTEPSPQFDGDHVRFSGLKFVPKPAQKPHPPIWIGGESIAARRRAGRLGDGWYPVGNNPAAPFDTPDAYAAGLRDVAEAADAAGRSIDSITTALYGIWYRPGPPEHDDNGRRRSFTGPHNAILEDVRACRDAGLQHLIIGGESSDLAHCLDRMREFESNIMRPLATSP